MKEYSHHDAVSLAQLVRRREVSAAELLDAALKRVEEVNPAINAVVSQFTEQARAALADGLPQGPLSGVPFLLKDLYALCTGMITTNGSRFLTGNVADHDTEMVARYKRAGLLIFGKTNTPEFGLTVSTEPRLFGATRNPWKLDYMAGGSSGGAAAAVAAGVIPAAHASDGGGSIRIPASCCGLFGLKPTRGRNPVGPDRGEGWAGMSCEHVITRSVRDSAAFLDVTQGPDKGAPYFATLPVRPYLDELERAPGRLRVGLATRTPAGETVHPECERAVREAAQLLNGFGHDVEEFTLSGVGADFAAAFRVIIAGNIRAAVDMYAARLGLEPGPDDMENITRVSYGAGGKASAADLARAVIVHHATGRRIAAWFDRYDVVLTPTLAEPPWKLGVFDMMSTDAEAYGRNVARFTAFTAPFNCSGNPAMTLPLHWSVDGLPIGVQIAGRYGDEATLFRLAGQIEQARPWIDRRPALQA
jgi:Asp-tRNA(Asn)/Glu-tRNA(Gln) amidotransferase A subunit family amidase